MVADLKCIKIMASGWERVNFGGNLKTLQSVYLLAPCQQLTRTLVEVVGEVGDDFPWVRAELIQSEVWRKYCCISSPAVSLI